MSQPPPLGYAHAPQSRNLKKVATYQRNIMLCILTYLGCLVLSIALPQPINAVVGLAGLATSVVGAVFVFMLALQLYNTAAGVILGILTLIPLIGLIVLLVINGRATKVLRGAGYKVGLLGVSPTSVAEIRV